MNGNDRYHPVMARGLSEEKIERVARELLLQSRWVTVRDVMVALRDKYGAGGRTERVCRILKRLEAVAEPVSTPPSMQELETLRQRVQLAEARAALSEERERQHQDLWAKRYADKVAELERQQAQATHRVARVTHEQYLRVHQRAVELARRLAKYEDPDKPPIDERD